MSMRSGQNLRIELRMNNCLPYQLQLTTLQTNMQNNLVFFPRPPVPSAPYLQMLATPLFNVLWSGTTRVGRYQKKHSSKHTHPDHWISFIKFLHLLRSIASSLFSLRAWQTVLCHNLSPGPLWSSSWSWTLYFVLHAFLHQTIVFFSQHMNIPTQPVLL